MKINVPTKQEASKKCESLLNIFVFNNEPEGLGSSDSAKFFNEQLSDLLDDHSENIMKEVIAKIRTAIITYNNTGMDGRVPCKQVVNFLNEIESEYIKELE